MTTTESPLIKIGFDESSYRKFTDLKTKYLSTFNELISKSEQALGMDNVNSYRKLYDNPTDYVVSTWWKHYGVGRYPEHSDKRHVVELNSKINLQSLSGIKRELEYLAKDLKTYAPKIETKRVVFDIRKEDFNIYLREDKKEHYQALVNWLDATKKLRAFTTIGGASALQRTVPNNLQLKGMEAVPNLNVFKA